MKPCPCGAPAKHVCTDCSRPLCGWHFALSPVLLETIHQVPVCFPVCRAPFWAELDAKAVAP